MAQISGILGDVSLDGTALTRVTEWTINETVNLIGESHSDSAGWDEQTMGNKSWSGTITVEADSGCVPLALNTAMDAGTALAFIGTAFTSKEYSGNIKLSGLQNFTVDVTGGTLEKFTFGFNGHGALTKPTV